MYINNTFENFEKSIVKRLELCLPLSPRLQKYHDATRDEYRSISTHDRNVSRSINSIKARKIDASKSRGGQKYQRVMHHSLYLVQKLAKIKRYFIRNLARKKYIYTYKYTI